MTYEERQERLKKEFPKEVRKYERAMNYQVPSVEYDALYEVLILGKEKSEYELTTRWIGKVREVLNR